METHVKDVVRRVTRASEENLPFPETLRLLGEAGVERYHADLVAGSKTFYLPDGAPETVECAAFGGAPADFDASAVERTVREIQAGRIGYLEFCRRVADAGCVAYLVSLSGRRAVYYGRTGDMHTEWFPGAR